MRSAPRTRGFPYLFARAIDRAPQRPRARSALGFPPSAEDPTARPAPASALVGCPACVARGGPRHHRPVDHNRRASGRLRQRRLGVRTPRGRGGRANRREEQPMPETPNTEFWRDLKPITSVFKPDARPEVYIADAPTDDERYYVPFTETVGSRPLWISPTQNRWCDILYAKGAGPGQPPLPPAAGLRLHDLRQVGLPRARLGRDRGRLRLRGAGRGAHARRLRARRADEGRTSTSPGR